MQRSKIAVLVCSLHRRRVAMMMLSADPIGWNRKRAAVTTTTRTRLGGARRSAWFASRVYTWRRNGREDGSERVAKLGRLA